jgi:hypothetical protein
MSSHPPLDPGLRRFAWSLSEAMARQVIHAMSVIEEYQLDPRERWRLLHDSLERFANENHDQMQDTP